MCSSEPLNRTVVRSGLRLVRTGHLPYPLFSDIFPDPRPAAALLPLPPVRFLSHCGQPVAHTIVLSDKLPSDSGELQARFFVRTPVGVRWQRPLAPHWLYFRVE